MSDYETKVGKATKEIALQLDTLLSDYAGDQMIILDEDSTSYRESLIASAKLYVIDWLRDRWNYKSPNEDMERIARMGLQAAGVVPKD